MSTIPTERKTRPPRAGDRLGHWVLDEVLGRGAFGATWRAVRDDGRAGALKVLDEVPGDELRALASICHPCVPSVLDSGGFPRPYLVMELARGQTLEARLRRPPMDLDAAQAVLASLADALAATHHAGLAHGDVKPANVVVGDAPGEVWLVDFGMAGRRGGTPGYAAPEQPTTGPTGPADVYALGRLARELLAETPNPEWLVELVGFLSNPDPHARPTAAEAADALRAHGVPLPEVSTDRLRRRALTVHVAREALDAALRAWSEGDGLIGIEGEPGSGRTHALRRVELEARASGKPLVHLRRGPHPWDAVRDALADPALPGDPRPLPDADGEAARAALAAADLAERAESPILLVDDLEELDPGSAKVVRILAERRAARLCVAGRRLPAWVTRKVTLGPLDRAATEALTRALLGAGAELGNLVDRLHDASGGVPGALVEALAAAVEDQVLVHRAGRWLVDDARLDRVTRRQAVAAPLPVLSTAARRVGAVLAVAGRATPLAGLARASGVGAPQAALQELLENGLATVSHGQAAVSSRAAAMALAPSPADEALLHRGLADWMCEGEPAPLAALGWHLAAAGDTERLRRLGPRCVRAATAVDASDGAAMAEAMARSCADPEITAARVDALVAAGRVDDARAVGEAADQEPAVLVALARLHGGVRTDTERALACIERARAVLGSRAPDGPVPLALVEAHAVALHRAGRSTEAAEVCAEGLGRPRPADDEDGPRWVQLATIRTHALERSEGSDAALQALDAIQADDASTEATLEAVRGYLLLRAGRFHEAARAMERAASERLRASDRARLLANAAIAQFQIGGLRQALASWERALLLFERLSARTEAAYVQNNLCVAYREVGRWERAAQAGQGALALARELGAPSVEASVLGNLGDVHRCRGDHDEARACWAAALDLLPPEALAERAELARRRAEVAADRSDPDAQELALAAQELAERSGSLEERCRSASLVALALARTGDVPTLEVLTETALAPLQAAGEARALADVRLTLAEAWLAAERPDQARLLADRVVAYAAEVGAAPLRSRADGIIARTRSAAPTADPRLARLLDLAVAVSRERELSTLLDAIASAALELLDAERSFVLLCSDGRRDEPVVVASRFREGGEEGAPSMTIVRRTISAGREIIVGDVGERRDIRTAESVVTLSLRSALCVPLVDGDDEVQGVIYVDSRDITVREWADAVSLLRGLAAHAGIALANARRLEQAQTRAVIASEIAHDISAPAQLVVCVAEELLEEVSPNLPELAEALRAASAQIVEMRRRFLDADHVLRPAPVHLGELLTRLAAQIGRVARQRRVSLVTTFQREQVVSGDAHGLDRAVSNLILNAVRMSEPGGTVELALLGDDTTAAIEVRDRGPGVPPDMLDRIFQRGVHLAGEGHGIGLSIVRRIALEHGGTASVRNREGGGAVFALTLPVARA